MPRSELAVAAILVKLDSDLANGNHMAVHFRKELAVVAWAQFWSGY